MEHIKKVSYCINLEMLREYTYCINSRKFLIALQALERDVSKAFFSVIQPSEYLYYVQFWFYVLMELHLF